FRLRKVSDGFMRVQPEDGHEIVFLAGEESQPMIAVQGHAMVPAALADWVLSDLFVGRWIDFTDYILVLEIQENVLRNRIVSRVTGLARKMQRRDDLVSVDVHHGFSFGAFV